VKKAVFLVWIEKVKVANYEYELDQIKV